MWFKMAVSVLLVTTAIALPGFGLDEYTPASLAGALLPARVLAAPDAGPPPVQAAVSAKAQEPSSPTMGMMGATMPMSGTMPMDMESMGMMMQMMGMMMQMMGHHHSMMGDMGMMGGMHATETISGTMPMDMHGMGMMIQMMGMMMKMHGMMGGDMGATGPMTGTMPMMTGDMDMMGMMSQMQEMMSQMQGMMVGDMGMKHGMMGGVAAAMPVTETASITESAASSAPTATPLLSQTVQAGMVGVTVQPLNLGTHGADSLDFEVKLETHSGSLDQDLKSLAALRVGDVEVAASAWNAPSGGHHIDGILSFPALDASGKPILEGATEVSLILRDLAGAGEQVLTWALASAETEGAAQTFAAPPFDAQFIDSMIEHHDGAIAMAKEAQSQATHVELQEMANAIISAQTEEIAQMTEWRQAWYPDLAPTMGTSMAMGDMMLSADPSIPFDQRFIAAMISHHQGAIEMAQVAQTQAEHTEIKELAGAIITAQQAEIEQMQGWLEAWFE